MGILDREPGQRLQCGEGVSSRQQDRVPGPAPWLPGEDQLRGGGRKAGMPGREGTGEPFLQHRQRALLASSHFLSLPCFSLALSVLWSLFLCLSLSLCVVPFVSIACLCFLRLSFLVSPSPCISFCFCLSLALSLHFCLPTSLSLPVSPFFLPLLHLLLCLLCLPSAHDPTHLEGEVRQEAWRRGEQGRGQRALQRSREEMA